MTLILIDLNLNMTQQQKLQQSTLLCFFLTWPTVTSNQMPRRRRRSGGCDGGAGTPDIIHHCYGNCRNRCVLLAFTLTAQLSVDLCLVCVFDKPLQPVRCCLSLAFCCDASPSLSLTHTHAHTHTHTNRQHMASASESQWADNKCLLSGRVPPCALEIRANPLERIRCTTALGNVRLASSIVSKFTMKMSSCQMIQAHSGVNNIQYVKLYELYA